MKKSIYALLMALIPALIPMVSVGEPLPMVYEAVTLATPPGTGQSTIAVIPRSIGLSFPRGGTPEAPAVLAVFESMKTRFAAAYGATTIAVAPGGNTAVTINLDNGRKESWRLVLAELFFTLKSFGFQTVTAPLFSSAPLDALSIDAVVIVPTQPWYRATGPDFPATALVTLDGSRMMATDAFRKGLAEGAPDLVRILVAGLKSPDDTVRLASVAGLGLTRAPEAHAMVPALTRDRTVAVRAAILGLASSGKIFISDADLKLMADQDPEPDTRLAAAKILAARGNHDFDHVLELSNLQSSDPGVVIASLKRLRQSPRTDLAPAVAKILFTDNPEARQLAVDILARFRAAGVMSRSLAAQGLPADVAEPLAIETVNICPLDETALNWMARNGGTDTAARALATACSPDIVVQPVECGGGARMTAILAACAGRKEPVLKERAIDCLGGLSDMAALDTLMPLVGDAAVGKKASQAAARVMSGQPQKSLVEIVTGNSRGRPVDRKTRLLALEALSMLPAGTMETGTISTLKSLMKDPDIEIRRAVVSALARSKDPAILGTILEGIGDQDEGIRRAAVVAAVGIPGQASDAVIRKSLEDLSTPVRIAGLEALAVRPIPDTRSRIRILAGNARPEVRRPAVVAWLKSLSPAEDSLIFPFVSPLLYDTDEEIRIIAVNAMEDLNDSPSANAIGALVIDQSPRVRSAVARVLGLMRTSVALQYLGKMAGDSDAAVRRAVVEALGRFRQEDSGPILRSMAERETDSGLRGLIDATLSR